MTDSILIIGGGLAGLSAALECTAAGARAIIVERDAIMGGGVAAGLTDKSSLGDSINGMPMPKLAALKDQHSIEFMTLAEVQSIDGRPGNFDVTILERARFVTDACTRCNHCKPVCPVVRPNEHDAGLSYRKAIYTPMPETLPQEFVIDIDACLNTPPNYLPCNRCIDVCDDDAIHFDMALEREHHRQVGGVVIATGVEITADANARERGYGSHPDVVTTVELERLLTAPGPTGGFVAKPSNEEYVNSIVLVLDDVSRQSLFSTVNQVNRLAAQDVGRIELLVTSQLGEDEQAVLQRNLPDDLRINYGLPQKIEPSEDNRITLRFADLQSSRIPEEQFDMVVLGSNVGPSIGLNELTKTLGCELDHSGFVLLPDDDKPTATSRAGIYAAGGAAGSVLPAEVVETARAAAAAALMHIDPRLLATSVLGDSGDVTPTPLAGPSEEDLRARFERALYALLGDDR